MEKTLSRKINKEWHLKNRMPKNPTFDQSEVASGTRSIVRADRLKENRGRSGESSFEPFYANET